MLDGMTAVVTGGAGGIGRAVCAGLAAAGARVAVVDMAGTSDITDVASAVNGRAYEVDVVDASQVREAVAAIAADLGPPRILVTLAGGSLGTPPALEEISPSDLDAVLDVNVKGTFHACQAVAPPMAAAGGGAIVTCSSIGARQPSPVTGVPYAAAKAAVLGMTRKLARELGPSNIRVNAVAPGLFLTDRLRHRFDEMTEAERAEVFDAIPLGRMPELREIVDPILFLAGEGASFITGTVLDVNGGRYMAP